MNDKQLEGRGVEIILKERISNEYWDGSTGWIPGSTGDWNGWRVVTGTDTWSITPPTLGSNIQYMVWARAKDKALNYSAGSYANGDLIGETGGEGFTYDNQIPTSGIVFPVGATNDRDSLASISGTTSEDVATA